MAFPFIRSKTSWNTNIRNVLIYFLSSGFSRSIPFLLLPLLTRILSPEDFGILGIATVFTALFSRIVAPGAPEFILTYYHQQTSAELGRILSVITNLAFYVSILLILIMTLINVTPGIDTILPYWTYVCIVIIAFFTNMLYIAQTLNQIEERIRRYVSYEISTALIIGVSVVLLVMVFGMNWEGRFLSIVIGYGIIGSTALYYLIRTRSLVITLAKNILREFLKFSLPYLPHSIGLWVLNAVGRLFLARYVNLTETGFFHVATQLLMILSLGYDALFKAWNPFFFRNIASIELKPQRRRKIIRYSFLCVAGIVLLTPLYLILVHSVLRIFIHEEFARSASYLNWLAWGLMAYGITRVFANFLYHTGKTSLLGISTLISAASSIPLVFFMYHLSGPVGVAQAIFLSFSLHALLVILFAIRSFPMFWTWRISNHVHDSQK